MCFSSPSVSFSGYFSHFSRKIRRHFVSVGIAIQYPVCERANNNYEVPFFFYFNPLRNFFAISVSFIFQRIYRYKENIFLCLLLWKNAKIITWILVVRKLKNSWESSLCIISSLTWRTKEHWTAFFCSFGIVVGLNRWNNVLRTFFVFFQLFWANIETQKPICFLVTPNYQWLP